MRQTFEARFNIGSARLLYVEDLDLYIPKVADIQNMSDAMEEAIEYTKKWKVWQRAFEAIPEVEKDNERLEARVKELEEINEVHRKAVEEANLEIAKLKPQLYDELFDLADWLLNNTYKYETEDQELDFKTMSVELDGYYSAITIEQKCKELGLI